MPGTKRLFVLRHAKSSWDDPMLGDHERPLAARGQRDVEVLSAYVREHQLQPQLVLCSSSRRTRETLEGVDPGGEYLIEPWLYEAGVSEIIERLRRLSPDVDSAMIVGHNPAMQMLVLDLARGDGVAEPEMLSSVERKFPTGALATLTFQCDWSELASGCARLAELTRPKAPATPS